MDAVEIAKTCLEAGSVVYHFLAKDFSEVLGLSTATVNTYDGQMIKQVKAFRYFGVMILNIH